MNGGNPADEKGENEDLWNRFLQNKRVLQIDRGDDNMNVLHTIELYTFKWLQRKILYVCRQNKNC